MEDKSLSNRVRAEGTVIVTASAFPIGFWQEWNKDCQVEFGDCRWIKMWNDHLTAKNNKAYLEVLEKLELLEKRLLKLENKGE